MSDSNQLAVPSRDDRLMAALAYPLWFGVFPLIYVTPDKRNNHFLRFHAYQGAAIGLLGVAGLSLIRAVLAFLLRWMIVLDVLVYPLLRLAEWSVFFLMAYGAVMAWRGNYGDIPYLSKAVRSLFKEEGNSPSGAETEI